MTHRGMTVADMIVAVTGIGSEIVTTGTMTESGDIETEMTITMAEIGGIGTEMMITTTGTEDIATETTLVTGMVLKNTEDAFE